MATKEERDTLRLLVQHVARAFYEPKYVIILDQLARHPVLKDDDLAGRMGLQAKELNKLMAVIGNDRLIHVYRQNELKEGAQRSVGRQYYYIDYKHFCDVVKWRIAEMRRIIDSGLRNELDNKGYLCPRCGKSYTPLEVDKLMNFSLGVFICEICGAEVVDNENAESVKGSQDRMQRFNRQMRFIIEGLRKTESMVIPALDVSAWIKDNTMDTEKQKVGQHPGLKIAGSSSAPKQDEGVGIVMSLDKDEATRQQERDAEAAAKRQQNIMPSWHLKSTITGDLTALGIQESARSMTTGGNAVDVSTDDTLKGLGTVGPSRTPQEPPAVVEDVKLAADVEFDYYEQYYASLAASNAASAQATPPAFANEELGGDEDLKPTIRYLDSLNEFRKRSRSVEDEGPSATKLAKVQEHAVEQGTFSIDSTERDPLVLVNGVPKPFSQVTEEDQESMTPDEYTAYFEVFQLHS
ncbi:TFIIE alpha subunit-domain-containing protein [Pisolithus marmoratus]|nr:TFIIE alpha subunit-domain-containing protein [Pisolithus marmoratus]